MLNNDYILRSDIQKAIGDWFLNDGDKRSMMQVFQDIPAADVEPKQRWTPVTEPPKMEGEYWVYYQSGAMGSMNYDDENGWGRWYDNGIYESWDPHDGVRYWMPLPEPPKGEDHA